MTVPTVYEIALSMRMDARLNAQCSAAQLTRYADALIAAENARATKAPVGGDRPTATILTPPWPLRPRPGIERPDGVA